MVFAPAALIAGDVSSDALPYMAASAALELAYLILLSRAYASGELSVVYPTARGSAPVLVLVFGAIVLGTATSAAQVAGVVLIAAGVLALRGFSGHVPPRDVLFGLAIGVTIASYTLVDKTGSSTPRRSRTCGRSPARRRWSTRPGSRGSGARVRCASRSALARWSRASR